MSNQSDFCIGCMNDEYPEGLRVEIERLRKIESAARNLVAQKGRHHTEQAYEQLAALINDVK